MVFLQFLCIRTFLELGGVISPILANMALDGMEKVLEKEFHLSQKGKVSMCVRRRTQVNFIRYADDFVVTASTPEVAQRAKQILTEFLKTRGLELSQEKTLISHIDNGFDFLGWTFRKFNNGKLITKPSKKSIKNLVDNLSETILQKGLALPQDVLIQKLNQKLTGWANYHQTVCAKTTFKHVDHVLYNLLYRWAKRRHPNKGNGWILRKYWHRRGHLTWVFSTDGSRLKSISYTPIIRHTKVRMDTNPYIDIEYFEKRRFTLGCNRLSGTFKGVWIKQKGCCVHCGIPLEVNGDRELLFKTPITQGGTRTAANMAYGHKLCNIEFNRNRPKGL